MFNKKARLLTPLLAGLFVPLVGSAQLLNMDTFQQIGAREATLTGATNSGGSLTYLDNSGSGRNDIGLAAPISSGSLTPFTQVGDTMTYSFRIEGITATNNQFTPLYRVGFDFGSTAALRYEISTGTQDQLRFGSNTSGNPFAEGTTNSFSEDNFTSFDLKDLRFDDGNEIDATVSLELVAIDGSTYDYMISVTHEKPLDPGYSASASYTFTDVDGNEVASLFHVTNSPGLVDGDAYTISNASLEFAAVPEPSTFALISGLVILGLVSARRRRSRK